MGAFKLFPHGAQPRFRVRNLALSFRAGQGRAPPGRDALQKNNISLNEIYRPSFFPRREGRCEIFIMPVVETENLPSSQLSGVFLCMSFFCKQLYCASINIDIKIYKHDKYIAAAAAAAGCAAGRDASLTFITSWWRRQMESCR